MFVKIFQASNNVSSGDSSTLNVDTEKRQSKINLCE